MPNTIRRDLLDQLLKSVDFPSSIVDLGGKRLMKRGKFKYSKNFEVLYVNIDENSSPDILSDINSLPFKTNSIQSDKVEPNGAEESSLCWRSRYF